MKAAINKIDFLKNVSPFSKLSVSQLDKLENFFHVKHYKSHKIVFRRDDRADSVFIVFEGEVAVQVPSKSGIFQTISTLGKSSCFGELSVLTGETRSATVVTTQNTILLSINKENFLKMNQAYPSINKYFQKLLAKRVVSANEQVAELIQTRDISGMQVIKEGNTFMAYNRFGDIPANNAAGFGLYKEDTRYLCVYDLFIGGERPILLHSSCYKNYIGETEMTNPVIFSSSGEMVPQDVMGISRKKYINDGFTEVITLRNFCQKELNIDLRLNFGVDFRDIFDVRGLINRKKFGDFLPAGITDDGIIFSYKGLNEKIYSTKFLFSPKPDDLTDRSAKYGLAIKPGQAISINCKIEAQFIDRKKHFKVIDPGTTADYYKIKTNNLEDNYDFWKKCCSQINTDNAIFNLIINRSYLDLRLLRSNLNGMLEYYDAGTPWYSCLFGRDSIITSLQTLILNQDIPKSALEILANKQGKEVNHEKDEEPGKILHELRVGELADTGEIPHTPYFGTVDATPLWIILLSELYKWSGDKRLLEKFWHNALNANNWMDKYGDSNGDGYVEYEKKSKIGLDNQGWKDSSEAIMEKDGILAGKPISLVEVQGYVYDAKLRFAHMAKAMGEDSLSKTLLDEARSLKEKFNKDFWVISDSGDYLAIALNGKKHKVESVSSNQGHALWSGILDEGKAKKVVKKLFEKDMFSGWGIRTLSSKEVGYNPFGYHLGTVWPHDNAIIAAGLKKYGFIDEANDIFSYISKAARFFEGYRLPELFCGFSKEEKYAPVPYPLACRPQAWAAGSIFMLIHSSLGLSPDPESKTLVVDKPNLPQWLNWLEISNLSVFGQLLDLRFERKNNKTNVKVLKNNKKIEIEVV